MSCAASTRPVALALALAACASPAAAASTAVEYFHAGYGHYFVTAAPAEIAGLDGGTIMGWRRTGESFAVFDLGTAGAAPVCRFWSGQAFAPKSSHFYTADPLECEAVKGFPAWRYEGDAFALRPAAAGACPAGVVPLHRLYNDGRTGAPNHRYTTKAALRAGMIAQGWIPEGVAGCVPETGPPVSVVAAGDIGECHGLPAEDSAAARTARLVTAQDSLVLTLGDHAYEDGTAGEFANCFDPTWGAFKPRIRPVPGNHDYNTPGAWPYYDYFGAQAGPDRRGWTSFDHGGWHFVALNSMADVAPGSPQYRWLQDDLARSAGTRCTIAYWHHPRFNSGGVYGDHEAMRPFFDLLHAAGVELVLSGHEHIYERFVPQRGDGTADPARGVRQFVVGTGGHALNPLGTPVPNSVFRSNTHWGVLRLTLHADRYDWAFVTVDGTTPLDAGSDSCR